MHERRLRARASSVSAAGHASSSASAAAADAPLSMPSGMVARTAACTGQLIRITGTGPRLGRQQARALQDGQPVPHRPPAAVAPGLPAVRAGRGRW